MDKHILTTHHSVKTTAAVRMLAFCTVALFYALSMLPASALAEEAAGLQMEPDAQDIIIAADSDADLTATSQASVAEEPSQATPSQPVIPANPAHCEEATQGAPEATAIETPSATSDDASIDASSDASSDNALGNELSLPDAEGAEEGANGYAPLLGQEQDDAASDVDLDGQAPAEDAASDRVETEAGLEAEATSGEQSEEESQPQLLSQDDASDADQLAALVKASEACYAGVGVIYDTHIQSIGWQDARKNGAVSGTSGRSLRLEGIHISLTGAEGLSGSIKYSTHVQKVGWQDAVSDGDMAGTSGRSLRLEGIKIWLTGDISKHYDVLYRTHVQGIGWQAWVKNGSLAGTSGRSLRLEAVQIKLSPKTEEAAGKGTDTIGVRYQSHVQSIGWQDWVGDGQTGGTSGKKLRVEALFIKVDPGSSSGGIEYQTHVQSIGWQDWVGDGQMAGTSGKGLRLEALRIRLTGDLAKTHDVYYRAHVQNVGWLDWAKNGADAGSSGCAFRMEAVEIVVKEKGQAAPGPTATPSYSNRWSMLETHYLNDPNINDLLEVKYTGGSNAQIVLRQKQNGAWKTILSTSGYVGREGIGKASASSTRTPEGNFAITKAFGIMSNPGSKIGYVKVNDSMYWCADSHYYNQLIDINKNPHYCTGEHLIDYAPDYNYGLFFDYNTNPVKYGAGSAFFVHCKGRNPYTSGCISMPQSKLVTVIRTIRPGARLLVYSK